jgi:murein hydrolase activator
MANPSFNGFLSWIALVFCVSCVSWPAIQAQTPDKAATEAAARRVAERMKALQAEADRLANQARTVVGDLRKLEIDRDLASERAKQAVAQVATAEGELKTVNERLTVLEQQRVAALPDLRGRFVEMYKRGRGSYARMLAGVRDLREFGRATRAIASLAHINQQRIEEHRRTLEALRKERQSAQEKTRVLQARRTEAERARSAAERALNARTALVAEIDRRRDLNAQLAGELLVAQQKLEAAVKAVSTGQPAEPVAIPIGPFRGVLEWPVVGAVTGRFGQSDQARSGSVRNGIEIAAPEGTPVRAVHPGTVGFADPFAGFGTLVILDHGANHYSLYGYLSSTDVERGQRIEAGRELGRVGFAPAGGAALYFEVRVDGRSVDPVKWLKTR